MAKSPYEMNKEYKKESGNGVWEDLKAITGSSDQAMADYAGNVTAAYEAAKQQEEQAARQQQAALSGEYYESLNKNELQQLINERQLAERMTRLGLTDSGLNRSQQTALQVQRSNADQAAAQQKGAAQSAIRQQAQSNIAALEQQKLQAIANAQYNSQSRKQDYLYSLLSSANDRYANLASSYYNGELNRSQSDRDSQLALLNLVQSMVPESQRKDKNAYRNYVVELLELLRSKGF